MPPQRRRVVEEAQTKIVGVVRKLEDSGELVISRGGDDRGRAHWLSTFEFGDPRGAGRTWSTETGTAEERLRAIAARDARSALARRGSPRGWRRRAPASSRRSRPSPRPSGRSRAREEEFLARGRAVGRRARARDRREGRRRRGRRPARRRCSTWSSGALLRTTDPPPAGDRGEPGRSRARVRERRGARRPARRRPAARRRRRAARRARRVHRPHRGGRDRRADRLAARAAAASSWPRPAADDAPPASRRRRRRDARPDAHAGTARRSPRPTLHRHARPRHEPDRPRDRGHRPARRGRRARARSRPAATARRCLPRWSASATGRTLLMPLGEMHGIGPGTARRGRPASSFRVRGRRRPARAACSTASAGRSTAAPSSSADRAPAGRRQPAVADAPHRGSPSGSTLGVRALDALVPCGRGQRLGIFAGSGVGKSTLLGIDRAVDHGVGERDLPRRRARPRAARVHRARPRRAPSSARSSSSPPPTSRRSSGSRPRSSRRRSPSTSATRATTCC